HHESRIGNHSQLVFELRLAVSLVSLDDHMNEVMAYDVFLVEVNELDPCDSGDHALSFHEPRASSRRQVDLSYVAGDYRFRSKSNASQKHLHLLGGGVLRFVQNDKCIRQSSSAHKRQRRD